MIQVNHSETGTAFTITIQAKAFYNTWWVAEDRRYNGSLSTAIRDLVGGYELMAKLLA